MGPSDKLVALSTVKQNSATRKAMAAMGYAKQGNKDTAVSNLLSAANEVDEVIEAIKEEFKTLTLFNKILFGGTYLKSVEKLEKTAKAIRRGAFEMSHKHGIRIKTTHTVLH